MAEMDRDAVANRDRQLLALNATMDWPERQTGRKIALEQGRRDGRSDLRGATPCRKRSIAGRRVEKPCRIRDGARKGHQPHANQNERLANAA
jgi:hypothetical protein